MKHRPPCPPHLQKQFDSYAVDHKEPSSFMKACILNDLKTAVQRAEKDELQYLPGVVYLIHWYLPLHAQGSEEAMENWIDKAKKD